VVLPKRLASILTARSELKLVVNELPQGQVGLPAVAFPSPGAMGTVAAAVKGLDSVSKEFLGVQSWQ
jgi:hypothetical protein